MRRNNLRQKARSMVGLSLVEILIVITIFSVLGILVTRSIILTLQGSKKSEGLIAGRENLDYAMSVIERQIRGSREIFCPNSTQLNYVDQEGDVSVIGCFQTAAGDSYVASGSGAPSDRITSATVTITACELTCEDEDADPDTPPKYVDVSLQARPANLTGIEGSTVTTNNRIHLRNY